MESGAEGSCPADLVRGRDIKCAASRPLSLVPSVISKLYRAVEILIGDKAYSTEGSVCWQQSRVGAACRWKVGPGGAAIDRKLPNSLVRCGTEDGNALLRTSIDIAGCRGQGSNGGSNRDAIVFILHNHRWPRIAVRPFWCIVDCTHQERAGINARAEGCLPTELVVGREIECAAGRSLRLVPGVIENVHRAVKIFVGHKAYSTKGAVGR